MINNPPQNLAINSYIYQQQANPHHSIQHYPKPSSFTQLFSMDVDDHKEHFPLPNPLPPETENTHRLLHGSTILIWSIQFLLSLSLLSLFITYLTGISLYYSYTYYFSTFFLPLATRALDRKCMFILCNGLVLVFLLGFRGLRDHDHHLGFDLEILLDKPPEDYVINVLTGVPLENEVEEEGKVCADDSSVVEDLTKDEEQEGRICDEDEEADRELVKSSSYTEDDEELNKKFDEFIKKMKEELRLEASE